ncbi:uncharacterized protein J3R85_016902 [Psidium guajava]|nr:uncharacterized protein J3R85_016902 [Psidium guajava]
MGDGGEVKLLGFWGSPYALRVTWALKLKQVPYDNLEEDLLSKKSSLLLQYNPVHKKVPVLVHCGRPIAESLVILEYIDEMWKQSPLLPQDPSERARARFWSKFTDEKCAPAIKAVCCSQGEEQQTAVLEARENLKTLESGLDGKLFFGGETINFADVATRWIGCWARIVEEITGTSLIDAEDMPSLDAWSKRFLELPVIKECVPPWGKLIELNSGFLKMYLASSK